MSTAAVPGRYPESQQPEETGATTHDQRPGSSDKLEDREQPGRSRKVASWLWRSLASQYLLYFPVLVTGIAVWQARKAVTVIAPFQVPVGVPFSGETVANILQDRLAQIHERIKRQK